MLSSVIRYSTSWVIELTKFTVGGWFESGRLAVICRPADGFDFAFAVVFFAGVFAVAFFAVAFFAGAFFAVGFFVAVAFLATGFFFAVAMILLLLSL